ncbi:hypothetical protein GCM10023172_23340 [Hymenobacter ginsengisoli]|uniref:HEPN domain-containing protein n=1 Tax=Hymenobacter ginsengisoli TaxID=1051626 RepID=A0ABP8QD87_9BACT|nr:MULTISPECIES: hypothetical protein [unclassified Hymenobacter]MBO2033271.1 hypothetical protein [Hymenobacter sp. BT559]
MKLIYLLNQLKAEGLLSQLYQAGALTLATLNHREAYLHYCALLAARATWTTLRKRWMPRPRPFGWISAPFTGCCATCSS